MFSRRGSDGLRQSRRQQAGRQAAKTGGRRQQPGPGGKHAYAPDLPELQRLPQRRLRHPRPAAERGVGGPDSGPIRTCTMETASRRCCWQPRTTRSTPSRTRSPGTEACRVYGRSIRACVSGRRPSTSASRTGLQATESCTTPAGVPPSPSS